MTKIVDFWEVKRQDNAKKVQERVSPSQVVSWEQCPRRWYASSVMGLRGPQTDAQARGTEIHTEIEKYLQTGTLLTKPTKWGELVRAAIPHLPKPSECEIEQWVTLPTFEGGPEMRGRFDIRDFTATDQWDATVHDTKTTSDVRRYHTPAEKIPEHVQLNIYGKETLVKLGGDGKVRLRLIHMQTRGAKTVYPTEAVVTPDQIEVRWQKTLGSVRGMMDVARELPAFESVMPNTESCGLYGGCEYRGICHGDGLSLNQLRDRALGRTVEVIETEKPKRESTSMGKTLDEIIAEKAAKKSANGEVKVPPQAAPVPTVTQTTAPAAPAANGKKKCEVCKGSRFKKDLDPKAAIGAFIRCDACGATGFAPETQNIRFEWPDGSMRPVPFDPDVFAQEQEMVSRQRISHETQSALSPDAPPTDSIQSAGPPSAEEPKKRSRKPKVEAGVAVAAETPKIGPPPMGPHTKHVEMTDVPSIPVPGTTTNVAASETTQAKTNGKGCVIYVDCMPTKGPDTRDGVRLEDWIRPILDETAARLGKADYRLQEYTAEAELAVSIRTAIKAGKLPRVMLVTELTKARPTFLEQAVPEVDYVIRGV